MLADAGGVLAGAGGGVSFERGVSLVVAFFFELRRNMENMPLDLFDCVCVFVSPLVSLLVVAVVVEVAVLLLLLPLLLLLLVVVVPPLVLPNNFLPQLDTAAQSPLPPPLPP